MLWPRLDRSIVLAIVEILDDDSLLKVISHFKEFCASVSLRVVERVLRELFGEKWLIYYNAYADFCRLRIKSRCRVVHRKSHQSMPFSDRQQDSGIWGAGYALEFPPCESIINGFVVKNVLATLQTLVSACRDHDVSFVPGPPEPFGIDRVHLAENGRILWIQYHSQMCRVSTFKNLATDKLNMSGSYVDCGGRGPLKLDGQIIPNRPTTVESASLRKLQLVDGAKPSVAHEVWDLAASSHPRCMWSSFRDGDSVTKDVRNPPLLPSSRFCPVRIFSQDWNSGSLLPTMRPIRIGQLYAEWNDVSQTKFASKNCMVPARFLFCHSEGVIVDILRLSQMKIEQQTRFRKARVSEDFEYLVAALSAANEEECERHSQETDTAIAIWHVELPQPRLLWDPIPVLCTECGWTIDKGWLIMCCPHDGARVYNLKANVANPVNISTTTGIECEEGPFSFKVCGPGNDILVCDGLRWNKFSIVQLKMDEDGKWHARRTLLSTRSTNFSVDEAESLGLGTLSYIRYAGTRYLLTSQGELFDLSVRDTILEGNMKNSEKSRGDSEFIRHPRLYSVVALREYADSSKALIAVKNAARRPPSLEFWLLQPQGRRQLICGNEVTIPANSVRMIAFAKDGKSAIVLSRINAVTGWIVSLSTKAQQLELGASLEHHSDFRILTIPSINKDTAREMQELTLQELTAWFSVATREVLGRSPQWIIAARYLSTDSWSIYEVRQIQRGTLRGGRLYDIFNILGHVYTVRFNGTTLSLKQSDAVTSGSVCPPSENIPEAVRQRTAHCYRRWVEILQEEPRDIEYCSSIKYGGTGTTLSANGRFLAYIAHSIPEMRSSAHVELRDLYSPQNMSPNDIRRSRRSQEYYHKTRSTCVS